MSLFADCASCSKTYRVPHDRKTWHCKLCRAPLELRGQEPAGTAAEVEGRACPACDALAFGVESFCEECGHELPSAGVSSGTPDRREASAEMRRAHRRLQRLKTWLGVNFGLACLGLLLIPLWILAVDELGAGVVVVLTVVQLVTLGLAYLALRMFDRHPLPIVLSLAALNTLSALWAFFDGEGGVMKGAYAALLWMLSIEAGQATRLARQFPDLYLSRRMRGEHLSHRARGGSADSIGARRRAAARAETVRGRKRAAFVALGLAALVAVVVALGSVSREPGAIQAGLVSTPASSPSPEAAIGRFQAAWNQGSIEAMVEEAKESLKAKLRRSLGSFGERYGWGDRFPPLEGADWEEPSAASVRVRYAGEAGVLEVRFVHEGDRWCVRSMDTREIRSWQPR